MIWNSAFRISEVEFDSLRYLDLEERENFTKLFQDFCKYCNIEVDTDYQVVI